MQTQYPQNFTLSCKVEDSDFELFLENGTKWKYFLTLSHLIVYAPTFFDVKKNPNIVNGSRNLFNLMKRGRELLRPIDKKEYDDFMVIILNNSYFLLQEHITLGLLSDTRRPLRILGKKIILKGGLISESISPWLVPQMCQITLLIFSPFVWKVKDIYLTQSFVRKQLKWKTLLTLSYL